MENICPNCGKAFTGRRYRQKYCSVKCKCEHQHRLRVERDTRTCPNCGKQFIKPHPSNIYCSVKCKCEHQHRLRAERDTRTCPVCGKAFLPDPGKDRTYCSRECYLTVHAKKQAICPICGKTFASRHPQKYCSRKCSAMARSVEPVQAECLHCGKTFTVRPTRRNANRYCSRECYAASKIHRVDKTCPICGKTYSDTRTGPRTCPECRKRKASTGSALESDFYHWISKILGKAIRHDRKLLDGREIDILYPKIGFECQGNRWHANPRIFKKDDIPIGRTTAGEIWEHDRKKRKDARKKGVHIVEIWEDRWYSDRKNTQLDALAAVARHNPTLFTTSRHRPKNPE